MFKDEKYLQLTEKEAKIINFIKTKILPLFSNFKRMSGDISPNLILILLKLTFIDFEKKLKRYLMTLILLKV